MLRCKFCNRSLGAVTVHEINGRPTLNEGMTRYTSCGVPLRESGTKNSCGNCGCNCQYHGFEFANGFSLKLGLNNLKMARHKIANQSENS